METSFRIAEEVREALAAGRPVVALETSVVAQGLPPPFNMEAHRLCVAAIRARGAVPAPMAVVGGAMTVGASDEEVARLADLHRGVAKASARDLAALAVGRRDAGTTVAGTVALALRAAIPVVATGGIGGVHRALPGQAGGPVDVSADLAEIARSRVCVVSSGPKAILDLPATAEALETLGVPAIGLGTGEMPAFYCGTSGVPLEHRVEDAGAVARLLRVHWETLGRTGGVLVLVSPPEALPRDTVESAIEGALAEARALGIMGKAVTPFLLERVASATGGRARTANLALLERNAAVAAEIASALAAERRR